MTTARLFRALTAWVTKGDMANNSRHRNLQGGASRAAVLGAGDGLITNVSLILGVAGASTSASQVRLAGIAGLLAGAFSMAAGELVSVRAQDELVQRELHVERGEIEDNPDAERRELAAMYRARGVAREDAETVARILNPSRRGLCYPCASRTGRGSRCRGIGLASEHLLVPVLCHRGLLALNPVAVHRRRPGRRDLNLHRRVAAAALGAAIGAFTGRGILRTAIRQLTAAVVAAGITFGVGHVLGGSTH